MGSGFKNFTAGNVLTEDDLDLYLMRQSVMTFTSSAARDSALSGVLDEGMVAYLEDTNRTTIYDGSAWIVVDSPWAAYTPTLTNVTLGNGTLDFDYRYDGWESVHVRGKLTFGTTTSVTGHVGFGYPDSVTAVTSPRSIGTCWYTDATSTDSLGTCTASSSILTYTDALTQVTSTVPFTWATTDTLDIDIVFEIS